MVLRKWEIGSRRLDRSPAASQVPRGFLFLHEGRRRRLREHGGGSVSMHQGVHAFHGPAAGEHAPDADVLVYDENVRILALLESAL